MAKLALVIAVGVAFIGQAAQNIPGVSAADLPSPSQSARAPGSSDIFHVAIFRFPKEHITDATGAFRLLADAARQETGNLAYDVYRGKDDAQEFYVVEHWASTAALSTHGRSDTFIRLGQGVLVKYATLHDTVTADAFDVVNPSLPRP